MPFEPFGRRIKHAYKTLRGFSQRGLAVAVSKQMRLAKPLTHAAVGKWANETRREATVEANTLFAIADVCGVNARWLALGTGTPDKWENVTPDEKKLLAHFRAMDADWKAKLLAMASDLPKVERAPSRDDPYPHLPAPKRHP